MDKQTKANEILKLLKQTFPTLEIPLHHRNSYELLIATILSAQTTDVSVNKVTPVLFAKYPTPQDLAQADVRDLENIIKTIGFHHIKSKNIKAAAQMIMQDFGGKVPETMEDLIKLPGVGRKVASVVLWHAFGKNIGFTVDTHVIRLSNWFGLTESKDPKKIEQDLMQLFPQEEWGDTSLRLILLGRTLLTARNPRYKGTLWETYMQI